MYESETQIVAQYVHILVAGNEYMVGAVKEDSVDTRGRTAFGSEALFFLLACPTPGLTPALAG